MKVILCPTDFSDHAENAARYSCSLAHEFNSRLVLVHVYDAPVSFTEAQIAFANDIDKEMKNAAQEKLSAAQAKLKKEFPETEIETLLLKGIAADEICKEISHNNIDMLVIGATGISKVERLLIGSTASKVIRNANCPVFCIPPAAGYESIKKIVFATDLHDDNIKAALNIVMFAKHFNAEIVFLFVDNNHQIQSDEAIAEMTEKIRTSVRYPKLSGFISRNKNIAKGIEFFLEEYPAQVLVMFTHEKHFPEIMFGQSITRIMSHQTKIPLLTLKSFHLPVLHAS